MSDKSNETQVMIGVAVALLMLIGLWYLLEDDITWLVAKTRAFYLWLLSFFTDKYENIRLWLLTASTDKSLPPATRLDWEDVKIVSVIMGDYMRWPVAAYFCYCIYWAVEKTPRRKYRTKYNLNSLLKIQSAVWPVIRPIVNFDPGKLSARIPGQPVPDKLPPMAESLSPDEWIAFNRIPMHNGKPDEEAMRQVFTRQLGPKWEGLKGLKPHHRALLAAFVLKGQQKRRDSDDLLGAIASCWSAKTGLRLTPELTKRINAILNDRDGIKPAMDIGDLHAYRTTALLGILKWCREQGGVLAPAQFLWLRAEDRALWYPLNNLGRRSYHAEAAGAMAHFMAEQIAMRALPMPRVDNAIPAITNYIKENVTRIPGVIDNAQLKMS